VKELMFIVLRLFRRVAIESHVGVMDLCLFLKLRIIPKIRPETLKLVQERAGTILKAIGIGKDFLNRT
jgi:hypothetical protein